MQMVFHNPFGSLIPGRTVTENVAEPLRIHRIGTPSSRRDEAHDLLEMVGLGREHRDKYIRQLSGGQQQRVAIARALTLRPSLLVCDEPTSALDVSIQAQVLELLGDLQRELGFATVFITHNLAVAEKLCDTILVMRAGKVVESGPTHAVFGSPRETYTRQLLKSCLSAREDA
jgi:ABC-type glutathione transport system ATPase component